MLPEKSSLTWVKVSSLEGVMASLLEESVGMSLMSEESSESVHVVGE